MALTLLADRQYTAPSAADSVTIIPSAVAWTNSAYVTVLASTPAACVLTGVVAHTTHDATYDAEVDIATGAVGVEVVVATIRLYNRRIASSGQSGPTQVSVLPIPIDNIAAGVRVAARLRKNNTATTVWSVAITYLQKPLASTILTTANVQKTLPPAAVGVTLTASGSVWVSGTWGQLRAATGAALVITGIVAGAPSNDAEYELDLGTGPASSETVITTIRLWMQNFGWPAFYMLPTPLDNVAASTRLTARLRASSASATMVVSVMVLEKPL